MTKCLLLYFHMPFSHGLLMLCFTLFQTPLCRLGTQQPPGGWDGPGGLAPPLAALMKSSPRLQGYFCPQKAPTANTPLVASHPCHCAVSSSGSSPVKLSGFGWICCLVGPSGQEALFKLLHRRKTGVKIWLEHSSLHCSHLLAVLLHLRSIWGTSSDLAPPPLLHERVSHLGAVAKAPAGAATRSSPRSIQLSCKSLATDCIKPSRGAQIFSCNEKY